MKQIHYEARDGVRIAAYVTIPTGGAQTGHPAVVLPHGGPHSRDYWCYDMLAQYFAARGYVVLQSNYRGSGGFGDDWLGLGGFHEWRKAISDIDDGLQHLVDSELVDPSRVCIVGWCYGGYAALLSAAEYPARHRCVVSIAGVTDVDRLALDEAKYKGGRSMRYYFSSTDSGSPVNRADDIQAPVLLFHGEEDINVFVKHSAIMEKALRKKNKAVSFIEYEDVEHSILRNEYRIDMLTRIGAFLDESTSPVGSGIESRAEP
jgi:dipeptidyl aminopeptidase/acylaminoacyl peptidase